MNNPRIIRRSILLVALLLFLFAAFRLSFLDGLLRRTTIDGSSMAPAFCGAHYAVTCHDCNFRFPCDAEHLPPDNRAACPNCGYTDNSLDDAEYTPPDQVLIDRWPLLWSSPRRSDVVAVALPGSPDIAVKRIAGLPNELLSIASGDLFADGKIIRKTPANLHPVRQLVHDNNFQPNATRSLPPRWRPSSETSHWRKTASGFRIEDGAANPRHYDWLQYEHWKCTADPKTRGVASPITDNDSYNQGETHRPLNVVNDFLLSCHLRTGSSGDIAIAAFAGNHRFEVVIESRQNVVLRAGSQILAEKRLTTNFSHRVVRLEFGLCDQQVLLVIDGRTVFRHAYQLDANSKSQPLQRLAFGARGIPIELTNLRVWRDLYYLDPEGLSLPWSLSRPIKPREYAPLGDNQPVSIDSRQWQPAAIPQTAIRGHVYQPFWTSSKIKNL